MEEDKEDKDLDVIVTYKLEGRRFKKIKALVIDFAPDDYLSNPEPEYQEGEVIVTFFVNE